MCQVSRFWRDIPIILHNLFLVDKVLNAYYVKLLAPPTIIHPLYSKKNKNGTVHMTLPYIIQYTPESHVFVKISPDGDG